jgi:hypothetical protein
VADRYLREALLSSERWNACSPDARDLYVRLLMLVDDFGVFDGRDHIVAQKAYLFRRDEPLALDELQRAGLIVRFANAARPYVAITQWGESLRGRRRFPAPPVNVDLPDIKYRGKYGAAMRWANPQGSDAVSILIDLTGRAATPQPPEWRRVDGDWMPNGSAPYIPPQSRQAMTTSDGTPLRQAVAVVTEEPDAGRSGRPHALTQLSLQAQLQSQTSQPSSSDTSHGTPSLSPATTTPTNGVEFKDGKLEASGEQVLRWQETFDAVSVPQQLDRAAAWLGVNRDAREAIERGVDTADAFVVRWLLRETKQATTPTKARVDA